MVGDWSDLVDSPSGQGNNQVRDIIKAKKIIEEIWYVFYELSLQIKASFE